MKYNIEIKQCDTCMERHEVYDVKLKEKGTYKNEMVEFDVIYEYCSNLDEYSENEEMMRINSLSQKDAYRKKLGLLTSQQIKEIREQYQISQKDFSEVLCWGGATITRYENHQVQDRAHDDILRKIKSDPKWFLEMLNRAKERLAPRAYRVYYERVLWLIKQKISHPYKLKSGTTSYSFANVFERYTSGEINFEMSYDPSHNYFRVNDTRSIQIETEMANAA